MRPFALFPTFFSCFSAVALVAANPTETIGTHDQRISYSDGWKFRSFSGRDVAFIHKRPGTATLEVKNASSIAVSVFVEKPDRMVRILLDNQAQDIFPTFSKQPAFSSGVLDPSTPHTIKVITTDSDSDRGWTALGSFIVTYFDPANTTNPAITADSASTVPNQSTSDASIEANSTSIPASLESLSPTPQAPASNQSPNTEPVLSGGKLAAILVVCITVPALIIASLVYRQRRIRKRKAASTEFWEWMANRAQVPPSQPPPPTPPDEKFDGAETREMA